MRYAIKNALAATFVASAAAAGHHHGHQHLHARSEVSSAEKREAGGDAVVEWVAAATETVYQLGEDVVDAQNAAAGIENGDYVVVGETKPTVQPPPPEPSTSEAPPPPKPTTSKTDLGAQFIEKKPEVKQPYAEPKPKPVKPTSVNYEAPSSGGGDGDVTAPFPDGKVKCSEFPSAYGAVALDWLKMSGWSGLQRVPDYSSGAQSISKIITGIAGESCEDGTMCSYACPPGYQKTQWPEAQGADKESVGGLLCKDGKLHLTRPEFDTLCEPGVGGVSIKNELNEVVSTCRTDYPGTEAMVIPATAKGGSTVDLCNPDQEKYYQWTGLATSAQFYINPKGVSEEDGCIWSTADGPGVGNWAPMIAGTGMAKDGNTYLSIFQNPETTKKLDFNIEITGDGLIGECAYSNGKFTGGGNGCTTTMKKGGKAVFRYF